MIKNAIIYRISESWSPDLPALEAALAKSPFAACGATQGRSAGWVPPRGEEHGLLAESVAGQWFMRFMTEAKVLPASVLNRRVEEKADHIEATEGRRPGKKEKKDLKEELLTNREMGIKMINLLANRKGGGTSGGAPKYARPGYRRETQATRGGKGMGTDRGQLLVNTARDIQAQEKAAGRLCSFWKAKNLAKIRLGQK